MERTVEKVHAPLTPRVTYTQMTAATGTASRPGTRRVFHIGGPSVGGRGLRGGDEDQRVIVGAREACHAAADASIIYGPSVGLRRGAILCGRREG